MNATTYRGSPDDAIRDEIDRELALVESAARLVNLGVARRVTIGNLPFAGAVVDRLHDFAAQLQVRIRPIFDGGERAQAVAVETEPPARA